MESQRDNLWALHVPSISQLSTSSPKDSLDEGAALNLPTPNSSFSSTAGTVLSFCAAAGSGDVGESFQDKSMQRKG